MRVIVWLLAVSSAAGQNAATPAFEVASVKVNQQWRQEDRSTWRSVLETPGDRLTMRNLTMRRIVAWAYHVQSQQVVGPGWIDTEHYDILARTAKPAVEDEMRPMLEALLAERFHLAVHRDTRQMEVLALLQPKGGHKMTVSQLEGPPEVSDGGSGVRVLKGISLAVFADELSHETTAPIVDMTGLEGRFDFKLNLEKYVSALRSKVMADPQHIPPESELHLILLQDMVAGELGLRVEPRRAPVEVVVIERAEKVPVEN